MLAKDQDDGKAELLIKSLTKQEHFLILEETNLQPISCLRSNIRFERTTMTDNKKILWEDLKGRCKNVKIDQVSNWRDSLEALEDDNFRMNLNYSCKGKIE